jgi:hypothetical protein
VREHPSWADPAAIALAVIGIGAADASAALIATDEAARATAEVHAATRVPARRPRPLQRMRSRSDGSSKTTDLAAVALALLLTAPDRSRFYWGTSDVDQAGLALDAIGGFCSRSDDLASAVELQARRVVARSTGSTLEALPAESSSAFGLLPAGQFLDELASWSDTANARRFLDALTSSATKVPGCRMAILTSAGSPSHYS